MTIQSPFFRLFLAAVFAVAGNSQICYSDSAVPANFSGSASAAPAALAPGAVTTISASFTNSGPELSNVIADIEVSSAAGVKVGQKCFTNETLGAGATKTYAYDFTTPSTPGTYSVTLVLVNSDWAKQYYSLYPAATISVSGPAVVPPKPLFIGSATASPATVMFGAASTVSASFTNSGPALSNVVADIEIYDPTGKKVGQKFYTGQALASGGTNKYTYVWTAPKTTGTYAVTLVLVSSDWSKQYFALYPAVKIVVANQ